MCGTVTDSAGIVCVCGHSDVPVSIQYKILHNKKPSAAQNSYQEGQDTPVPLLAHLFLTYLYQLLQKQHINYFGVPVNMHITMLMI